MADPDDDRRDNHRRGPLPPDRTGEDAPGNWDLWLLAALLVAALVLSVVEVVRHV